MRYILAALLLTVPLFAARFGAKQIRKNSDRDLLIGVWVIFGGVLAPLVFVVSLCTSTEFEGLSYAMCAIIFILAMAYMIRNP